MFEQVEGTPSARAAEGWREIHYYAYVDRPFGELWPLLATQPNNVLGDGRAVPRGRGTSELHVHLGGVDVARNVAMQFSELLWDGDRAGLAVHCRAARHPGMFPLLEARFELAPLRSGRRHLTQVGLVGRYRPPLGVLGDMADRLGGSGIAAESIRRFVEDVARRLETVGRPERSRSGDGEPTPDVTQEPDCPELKKVPGSSGSTSTLIRRWPKSTTTQSAPTPVTYSTISRTTTPSRQPPSPDRSTTVTEPMYHPITPEIAARRKELAPEIHDAFEAFSHAVFADGALPEKTKQLIAVAVAHTTQCPYCIQGHTRLATRKGAGPQEIMEAIWVAAEMRAGGAYAHSTLALNALAHQHS